MDSPKRAPGGTLTLVGSAQGALTEACATLEGRAPVEGSLNANRAVGETSSEAAVDPAFLAQLAKAGPRKVRMPNRMVLSSYVQPMEWDHPSVDTPTPSPRGCPVDYQPLGSLQ